MVIMPCCIVHGEETCKLPERVSLCPERLAGLGLFPMYDGIVVMFSRILSPKLVVQELRVQKEALEKKIDKLANDAASELSGCLSSSLAWPAPIFLS